MHACSSGVWRLNPGVRAAEVDVGHELWMMDCG